MYHLGNCERSPISFDRHRGPAWVKMIRAFRLGISTFSVGSFELSIDSWNSAADPLESSWDSHISADIKPTARSLLKSLYYTAGDPFEQVADGAIHPVLETRTLEVLPCPR